MFEQTLLAESGGTSRPISVGLSITIQVGLVGTALLIPLFFIEPLPKIPLQLMPLMPRNTVELVEPILKSRAGGGGVLYSGTGGTPAVRRFVLPGPNSKSVGVIEPDGDGFPVIIGLPVGPHPTSIGPIGSSFIAPPAPAPRSDPKPVAVPVQPTAPVPVGGNVKAPVLVSSVKPSYPSLAITTRATGTVKLEAVISKSGVVESIRVLSGHPLLVGAAVDAVKQWRYQPGHLNGQPVDVLFNVDVTFTLNR